MKKFYFFFLYVTLFSNKKYINDNEYRIKERIYLKMKLICINYIMNK